jgi:TonB family protein
MSQWFIYLLESSVSLALLYAVYALFLSRDTFFTANRFFLAGSLIFSAVFPMINVSGLFNDTTVIYYYVLDPISITPEEVSQAVGANLGLFQVLLVAYLTGVSIFTVRFVVQLLQLGWLVQKYGITKKDGINLVLIHREYSPFSFFNLIFINSSEYEPEQLREIIEHEKIHISQKHTLDILLLELMTLLQWFNPFIWFYRRSLKGLHEFLADEGVLLKGISVSKYQDMLLNQALGIQLNDLTNNFNQSLLKRRLIMMTKQKSGLAARLKPLMALPVIVLMAMVFSLSGGFRAVGQDVPPPPPKAADNKELPPPPPPSPGDKEILAKQKVASEGKEEMVYKEVAQPPQFKGGQDAFFNYIVTNVKYPDEAKKKGISGKVFVEFIVSKTGKVHSPQVIKSVDPYLDAEAIRVMSQMPDWIPGKDEKGNPVNVSLALPIMFSLGDKAVDKKKE